MENCVCEWAGGEVKNYLINKIMKKKILILASFCIPFIAWTVIEYASDSEMQQDVGFYNGKSSTGDIWYADIKIDTNFTSVKVTKKEYELKARIKNDKENGNASAWGIKVTVLIPGDVKVLAYGSTDPNVKAGVIWKSPHIQGVGADMDFKSGYVTFWKDTLNRDAHFDIFVRTSKVNTDLKPNARCNPNFSVFTFNRVPEMSYENNFWFWRKQQQISECKNSRGNEL